MFRQFFRNLHQTSINRLAGLSPRRLKAGRGADIDPAVEHLLEAVQRDDEVRLAKLLKHKQAPALLVEGGPALLFKAARLGHWKVAQRLAEKMDLEARQHHGDTVLIAACARGQAEFARLLLRCGARPAAINDNGDTPLIAATRNGDTDTVQALLEAKAPPDALNHAGHTALLTAVRFNRTALVAALLEAGADPDLAAPDQHCALTVAIKSGYESLACRLLKAGATFDADHSARSLLSMAIEQGMDDLVGQMLARAGDATCEYLQPDIAREIREALHCGNDTLAAVLAARAAPDTLAEVDSESQTMLMLALALGCEAAAHALVVAGADPDQLVGERCAVLDAAERGDVRSLEWLSEWGADFETRNAAGATGLERAIIRQHASAVVFLVNHGVSLNRQNRLGATALILAVDRRLEAIVQTLLEAGADPNIAAGTGRTPLHQAALHDTRNCLTLLLDAGAHLEVRDNRGKTPLEIAHDCNNHLVVAALCERGATNLVGSICNTAG